MKPAYAKSHERAIQRGAQQADPEYVLALDALAQYKGVLRPDGEDQ